MVYVHVEKGARLAKENWILYADNWHPDAAINSVSRSLRFCPSNHAGADLNSDVVLATQQQLPLNLQVAFQQMIRPELIDILHQNLVPLSSTLIEDIRTVQDRSHGVLATRLAKHYGDLSAGMQEIKDQIRDSNNTQMRIESCLRGEVPRRVAKTMPMVESDFSLGNESTDMNSNQPTAEMIHQSLKEVWVYWAIVRLR